MAFYKALFTHENICQPACVITLIKFDFLLDVCARKAYYRLAELPVTAMGNFPQLDTHQIAVFGTYVHKVVDCRIGFLYLAHFLVRVSCLSIY